MIFRWLAVLAVALSLLAGPGLALAAVSHSFDAGLDDWGPDAGFTNCVWVSGVGRTAPGSMRSGASCLSPAYSKQAGSGADISFYVSSNWAGLSGLVSFRIGSNDYCSQSLYSSSSNGSVWDLNSFSCSDPVVLNSVSYRVVVKDLANTSYIDDVSISGGSLAVTPTPAPVETLTPTPTPFLLEATPTPGPSWVAPSTPTPVPAPGVTFPPTPTPGPAGSMYFPLGGSGLFGWASDFLSDWSSIIVPSALAALGGLGLVKLGQFMGR